MPTVLPLTSARQSGGKELGDRVACQEACTCNSACSICLSSNRFWLKALMAATHQSPPGPTGRSCPPARGRWPGASCGPAQRSGPERALLARGNEAGQRCGQESGRAGGICRACKDASARKHSPAQLTCHRAGRVCNGKGSRRNQVGAVSRAAAQSDVVGSGSACRQPRADTQLALSDAQAGTRMTRMPWRAHASRSTCVHARGRRTLNRVCLLHVGATNSACCRGNCK